MTAALTGINSDAEALKLIVCSSVVDIDALPGHVVLGGDAVVRVDHGSAVLACGTVTVLSVANNPDLDSYLIDRGILIDVCMHSLCWYTKRKSRPLWQIFASTANSLSMVRHSSGGKLVWHTAVMGSNLSTDELFAIERIDIPIAGRRTDVLAAQVVDVRMVHRSHEGQACHKYAQSSLDFHCCFRSSAVSMRAASCAVSV